MSFQEWLPFTRRNRVAWGLAVLSLAMFGGWNCMRVHVTGEPEPGEIAATIVWQSVLSPSDYIGAVKHPDFDGFLTVAANLALIQSGLVAIVLVPFWIVLHASSYIRLPLAFANLMGGTIVLWIYFTEVADDSTPSWTTFFMLLASQMLLLSASLFLFKNELALRGTRENRRS